MTEVRGRARALGVVAAMAVDVASRTTNDWENDTLDRFLGAMNRWLLVCERVYRNNGWQFPTDPWDFLADTLEAAKVYE